MKNKRKYTKAIIMIKIPLSHDDMLHRENLKKIIQDDHFRVALFGSARIKSEDIRYQEISEFARHIAIKGYDIVTGGGP